MSKAVLCVSLSQSHPMCTPCATVSYQASTVTYGVCTVLQSSPLTTQCVSLLRSVGAYLTLCLLYFEVGSLALM